MESGTISQEQAKTESTDEATNVSEVIQSTNAQTITVSRDGEHDHKNFHLLETASLYDDDPTSCGEVNSDRNLSEGFELTDFTGDICTPLNSGLNFDEMH